MTGLNVYKFGGASLKDAGGVKNVCSIINKYKDHSKLLVVVSAMGKTTNALEDVVNAYFDKRDAVSFLEIVKKQHYTIMQSLFDANDDVFGQVNDNFVEIEWVLEEDPHDSYDYVYDQIVSIGEQISSKIVAAYLNKIGTTTYWLDARDVIITDDNWREGVINWEETNKRNTAITNTLFQTYQVVLSQGFIASTLDNNTVTLGREGSDYSAAIFSNCLDADGMYIWKDVPGVLNGDPRIFINTVKLDEIDYEEAIEMTYYGASVIHPRTVAPLMQKNIPLHVKSFLDPEAVGTVVHRAPHLLYYPPIFMVERNQIFLKISNLDGTFLLETHILEVFNTLAKNGIFMNMIVPGGAYFKISVTNKTSMFDTFLKELETKFHVDVIDNLELNTIRHYTDKAINLVKNGREVVYEYSTTDHIQILMKNRV
jgi:aspartate kinase